MWRSMQTAMSPPTNSNLDERGTRGSAVFSLCRHATEVRNIRPNKAMPARFANGSSSLNEEPWRRLRHFLRWSRLVRPGPAIGLPGDIAREANSPRRLAEGTRNHRKFWMHGRKGILQIRTKLSCQEIAVRNSAATSCAIVDYRKCCNARGNVRGGDPRCECSHDALRHCSG